MANKNRNTLFRFSVIADTHIIENDAPAIDGYDLETVQLRVKRLAHIANPAILMYQLHRFVGIVNCAPPSMPLGQRADTVFSFVKK